MSALPPAVQDLVNFIIPASYLALLALALNIQWGYTGLFNAGIAGFWAVGAYTAAILLTPIALPSPTYPGHIGGYSQTFLVAAIGAMVITGGLGLAITLPLLRLRADYFAIATLALSEIIRLTTNSAESLTGGSNGIFDIPRPFDGFLPSAPSIPVDRGLSDLTIAGLLALLVIVAFLVLEYLTRSPWGRVLRGVREDDSATQAAGKRVTSFQVQSMVLGCALMGLAGAVFAVYQQVVTPTQFEPLSTFNVYVIVILGGSANNRGVIFGAFFFYALDFVSVRLKDYVPAGFSWFVEELPYIRLMVIGAILVLLILYRPQGIFPEKKRVYPPVT